MICRKCRGEIPDGSKFCMLCGAEQNPAPRRKALKRANGTGSVVKLSGHRKRPWAAKKNGIYIGYFETKTAALEAVNKLAGQDITEKYNMTFETVFKEWSAEHYKEITASGIETYDHSFDVFKELHKRIFRNLRTADFQAVIDKHKSKSYSTISKYKQLITQMYKWSIREGIVTTNLGTYIKLKEKEKKEKEIFSDADIKKLRKDGSEAARIVLMLLATGMRIGELFSLPLSDYHEKYVVGGEKSEAGRNRVIPIRPEGREHFEYFAKRATGELLLSGYSGDKVPANYRRRDYYPLLNKLHIDRKTPHATRHTYASQAVKEGMRPEILQRILGHSDYSTTANVYTHIDAETLIAAVEPVTNVSQTENVS